MPRAEGLKALLMKPSSRRPNRALFVRDRKIEYASVDQVKGQFRTSPMQIDQVHVIERSNAPFDLEIRRDGFALGFGEVLVDGEVVMHSPEGHAPLEQVAVAYWLVDEPLHCPASKGDYRSGGRRPEPATMLATLSRISLPSCFTTQASAQVRCGA